MTTGGRGNSPRPPKTTSTDSPPSIKTDIDIELYDHVKAIGVYGSVARGDADSDSDIDFLLITADERGKSLAEDNLGSKILKDGEGSRLGMTEVYTEQEYRNSLAHDSDFLNSIRGELHPIYDPDRVLIEPEQVLLNE